MGIERKRRVVVTGMGLVTPLGCDLRAVWRKIARGESGAASLPEGVASSTGARYYCPVRDAFFTRDGRRHLSFALFAAAAAIKDAGLDLAAFRGAAGVSVGSSKGGLAALEGFCNVFRRRGMDAVNPGEFEAFVGTSAAVAVARRFGLKGPVSAPVAACATGAHAILNGWRMITGGEADMVIAGATESWITPLMLAGYRRMGILAVAASSPAGACKPYDTERCGFVPGEGSGIVVLEDGERARARGAGVYAELYGGAVGEDTFHITAPDPSGEELGYVIGEALRVSGVGSESIDYVNTHGTGTRLNDPSETRAIRMAFGRAAADLSLSSTKPMTGHLLGAAGSVEFIISIMALGRGAVPPTINLTRPDPECDLDYTPLVSRRRTIKNVVSISCGFGGQIGVLVAGKMKNDECN